MARAGAVGLELAAPGLEHPIEEHRLHPDVVVKPFQVPDVRDRRADMCRGLRRAVGGDVEPVLRGERRDLEEARDAAAARDVGLQAVDGACRDQIAASAST